MQSAALFLREKTHLDPKDIVIVSSPTWLEQSHADWDSTQWGQSSRYLTPCMKRIAKTLFPTYPEADLLTYGMMKEILKAQRALLVDAGMTLIEDKVDNIVLSEKGLSVHSTAIDAPSTRVLTSHDSVHIFTAARCEQSTLGLHGLQTQARSYGVAYSMSKKEAESNEPMVILGSGVNLSWAARDFPNRQIIHLIPKGDRERPDLAGSLYTSIRMDEAEFSLYSSGALTISGVDLNSNKEMQLRVSKSQIFSSMGFFLNKALVKAAPEKLTLINTEASPKAIIECSNFSGEKHIKTTDMRGTVLPQGNLSMAYHQILGSITKLTDYPVTDVFAVMFIEGWQKAIVQKAMDVGIHINSKFFPTVHDLLKHSVTHGIPRDDQLWQVISNTFTKGISPESPDQKPIPVAINKEGDPLTWIQFKQLIEATSTIEASKSASIVSDKLSITKP